MTNPYDLARSILQKISCTLSATGSLMIISSVLRNKSNRKKTQQRILLAISCCDFLTSTVWIFTDLFMPPRGNQNTCDAQGFSIQFGNTSNMMLMVALQLQYLFTIKYGWKEEKIKKLEPILLILPFCFGGGTATTALVLDLFNPANWDCWIAPYPIDCTQSYVIKRGGSDLEETDCIRGDNAHIYQWAFFFALLWAVAAFCIFVMFMITKSVEKRERRSFSASMRNLNAGVRRLSIGRTSASGGSGTGRHSFGRNSTSTAGRPSIGRSTISGTGRSLFGLSNKSEEPQLNLTTKVKIQSMLYAMGFFVVWGFPTIARFIQLFGGTIHPIFLPLAGFFVGSQGLWNAMIYFRPRYSSLDQDRWWQKVGVLLQSSFFFFCEKKVENNTIRREQKTTTTSNTTSKNLVISLDDENGVHSDSEIDESERQDDNTNMGAKEEEDDEDEEKKKEGRVTFSRAVGSFIDVSAQSRQFGLLLPEDVDDSSLSDLQVEGHELKVQIPAIEEEMTEISSET